MQAWDLRYADLLIIMSGVRKNCKSIRNIFCKKDEESDCSSYQGVWVLSPSPKMLFDILLSRLIPHVNEIIGNQVA
jgi:hypothetical protein